MKNTAKILTKSGWKYIKDISDNEEILTLNSKTNKPEYQCITKRINESYKGVVYHIKGKNIDTFATPNHKFILEDRYGSLLFKTTEELYDLENKGFTHLKLLKSNNCWEFNSPTKFILKGTPRENLGYNIRKDLLDKYTKDVEIDYDVWMSFIGIYLAEGHTSRTRRDGKVEKKKSYGIHITQKHPEKTEKIWELLLKFPKEIEWKREMSKNETTRFHTTDSRLFYYLFPLGCCYDKYIPFELKNQSSSLLECLLDWYQIGDGRSVWYKGNHIQNIFSTSKRMMEDFQEVQLKTGGNGNILEQICPRDHLMKGRLMKKENTQILYVLKFNISRYVHIDPRFLSIIKEEFDDRVYCVDVPNQTFYCKENEKCFWSGI